MAGSFVNSDTSGNNHTKQFLDAEGTYVHYESAGHLVIIQEVNADCDVALPARAVLRINLWPTSDTTCARS